MSGLAMLWGAGHGHFDKLSANGAGAGVSRISAPRSAPHSTPLSTPLSTPFGLSLSKPPCPTSIPQPTAEPCHA